MSRKNVVQRLAGLLVILGSILVVIGAGLSAPTRVLIGILVTMGGAAVYWSADTYWERYEQFREPDIDYATRNTIYRSLFKTGSTTVQFGLVVFLANIVGITITRQALTSPPSQAVVASAVIFGLVLAGGMLAMAASLKTNGNTDRSPRTSVLVAQSPPLMFGVGLVVAPVAAIYFACAWMVGRLVGLPIAYHRSQ
ncbi:hypothetical protein EGH22_19470 [Halomicroarcula sp. F28]|uniref:hypothetical protein n=1 Tax=Haloarcula salinisoli TaxID=2487746 RepID=UPI001C73014F|nr:hypothetical protein [Halomicroarcula salinisoli]MBX0288513.1 hypothetical protein [Halomicroarcula salinisoli]